MTISIGEGSRGGHVIGHTRSGKPIYGAPKDVSHILGSINGGGGSGSGSSERGGGGNRTKDLQQAQQELHALGRQGWFAHDLQRGRVLVLEVLKWMREENLPVSSSLYNAMVAVEKSDGPGVVMRAVAAAEQAIRKARAQQSRP